MTADSSVAAQSEDSVGNVLKWVLLSVGIVTFAILAWTVKLTYQAAPPFPERFVARDGAVLMTASDDIQAGEAGFQKADLMDYGRLYGMGSYFGEDYTATDLVRLTTLTQDNIAQSTTGKALAQLTAEQQASIKAAMQVGLVSGQLAERSVYLELILIFLGGVIGSGHHLYWAGEPGLRVPMNSMFSFIEVLPLVLLVIEAIQHRRLIQAHRQFKYSLAYTYIIGAAFWNFVAPVRLAEAP